MSNPIVHWAIVLVVAFLAWVLSRNIDGPFVHWIITILAGWLAWKYLAGMSGGG